MASRASQLFEVMRLQRLRLDVITYSVVIRAYGKLDDLEDLTALRGNTTARTAAHCDHLCSSDQFMRKRPEDIEFLRLFVW